jgi:hypothetical protein
MKEQDRSLMKQFIDLRSTIVQLRCMYEFQRSNSDISSLSGSNYSLDTMTFRNNSFHFGGGLRQQQRHFTKLRGTHSLSLIPNNNLRINGAQKWTPLPTK